MHDLQTKTLSPKEMAEVIGVSESSIKRWVDDGLIDVTRTAGGHRRILLLEALRFIRERGMDVLRPEALGMTDLEGLSVEAREKGLTEETLFHLLCSDDPTRGRGLLVHAYLGGEPVGMLFDGPVAGALRKFGELWLCEADGILKEHRATSLVVEAVHQLRLLIPAPAAGAPMALGAAPSGDPYLLPTLMAATTLSDAGYETINLGPDTPALSLRQAVTEYQPRILWLAVKTRMADAEREALIEEVVAPLQDEPIDVVVGGDAQRAGRTWPTFVHQLGSMQELGVLARSRLTGEAR